jgi:hypothetical protein
MSRLQLFRVAVLSVMLASVLIGCGSGDGSCAMPTSFDGRIVNADGSPSASIVSGKVCVDASYKTPNMAEPDPMPDTVTICGSFKSDPASGTFSTNVPAPGPVASGDARSLSYSVRVVAADPIADPIASAVVVASAGCGSAASVTVKLAR